MPHEPLWRMPTRAEAVEILVAAREPIEKLLDELDDKQMTKVTLLGGGSWSVKDLLGHLAGYEEDATAIALAKPRPKRFQGFESFDERNAADIEYMRKKSLKVVRAGFEKSRAALVHAIEDMDDERWTAKVETGKGRSALGLVLGRFLVGGKHGLFAHDLAHARDLERSVEALKGSGS